MASGKTLDIFKVYDNYKRQNKKAICLVPAIVGETKSRIKGIEVPSILIDSNMDLSFVVSRYSPDCVLIEEAQFLNKKQVLQLCHVVDILNIPVIAYGLKSTYQNTLFEGSYWLLVYADKIEEVKTTCYFCNKKAIMVLRLKDGELTYEGPEVSLKNEKGIEYFPVCRRCYNNPILDKITRGKLNE